MCIVYKCCVDLQAYWKSNGRRVPFSFDLEPSQTKAQPAAVHFDFRLQASTAPNK